MRLGESLVLAFTCLLALIMTGILVYGSGKQRNVRELKRVHDQVMFNERLERRYARSKMKKNDAGGGYFGVLKSKKEEVGDNNGDGSDGGWFGFFKWKKKKCRKLKKLKFSENAESFPDEEELRQQQLMELQDQIPEPIPVVKRHRQLHHRHHLRHNPRHHHRHHPRHHPRHHLRHRRRHNRNRQQQEKQQIEYYQPILPQFHDTISAQDLYRTMPQMPTVPSAPNPHVQATDNRLGTFSTLNGKVNPQLNTTEAKPPHKPKKHYKRRHRLNHDEGKLLLRKLKQHKRIHDRKIVFDPIPGLFPKILVDRVLKEREVEVIIHGPKGDTIRRINTV